MDKKSIRIAKEFGKRLKNKFNVGGLILFGSRAREDFFSSSDFDFILISEDFEKIPFIFRASKIFDYWNQKEDLEILCYTPKEFEKIKNKIGIVNTATKEGIKIF
ncbi:MAG: nucleotidyltransferase domain-containing protein [Nanoarchaeota archaeon]|nr:nucleotidyltransferase domain-containing protein [Nanoarchaeota archaeon]